MKCDKGWKRRFRAFAARNGPRPGEEGRGDQEAPKIPPRAPQEAPTSGPGGPKRAPRKPVSRSRGLKTLQDRPKRLQKAPKTFKFAEIAEAKLTLQNKKKAGGRR